MVRYLRYSGLQVHHQAPLPLPPSCPPALHSHYHRDLGAAVVRYHLLRPHLYSVCFVVVVYSFGIPSPQPQGIALPSTTDFGGSGQTSIYGSIPATLPVSPRLFLGLHTSTDDCHADHDVNLSCDTSDTPSTVYHWTTTPPLKRRPIRCLTHVGICPSPFLFLMIPFLCCSPSLSLSLSLPWRAFVRC
ncbi:hypothetical protein EV126DRAFT_191259 [Verticillium dahliae]|nr:hypothetical protein EV126DRAFT_191259 [Verticillium dahliae]